MSLSAHIALLAVGAQEWPSPWPVQLPSALSVFLMPPPQPQQVPLTQAAPHAPLLAGQSHRPQDPVVSDTKALITASEQPTALTMTQPTTGVDVETAKQMARALGRQSSGNATPERNNLAAQSTEIVPGPLARAVTRSTSANCREKYAGLGLLGIPLLLKDSVSDGCVW